MFENFRGKRGGYSDKVVTALLMTQAHEYSNPVAIRLIFHSAAAAETVKGIRNNAAMQVLQKPCIDSSFLPT